MRRAVVIGSNGPPDERQLKYSETDAHRLRDVLRSPACGFVVDDAIGATATFARQVLLHAVQSCSADDTFVAYLGGHGKLHNFDLFFLFNDTTDNTLLTTSMAGQDVLWALRNCRAKNKLLVLDCCNAGQITYGKGLKAGAEPRVELEALGFKSDIFEIIMASDALESAKEFESLQAGFLSSAMCDALSISRDNADNDGDGAISVEDLGKWLISRAVNHNRSHSKDDHVPIPRIMELGHGTTYLTKPPGQFPYHEIMLANGIPGVILPINGDEHAYAIGKYPVTNDAYRKFASWVGRPPMARKFENDNWNDATFSVFDDPDFGDPNKPVVGVTLKTALSYCMWLNGGNSLPYSLVTPVIWDIAVFGNYRPRHRDEYLTTQHNIHAKAKSTAQTVGAVDRANSLGVIDMIGNVWEWCGADGNEGITTFLKGGSFYDDLGEIDLTLKSTEIYGGTESMHADVGFRILSTIELSSLPPDVRDAVASSPLKPREGNPIRPTTGR